MVNRWIKRLVQYGIRTGLIEACDRTWATNRVLEIMGLDAYEEPQEDLDTGELPESPDGDGLPEILEALCDAALKTGALAENSIAYRDLFDTKLMGALAPRPSEMQARFQALYRQSPRAATDWFYQFAQDVNYIRRDRIAKDMKWIVPTEYGDLDITINLSKPEKDPKAIAAAKRMPQSSYPKCMLCRENEGYAGRIDYPARQNHRIMPVTINGSDWFLQYSPYVYYNEHCIVFNACHTPMKIEEATFRKMLDFVKRFPHYFVGSNADLPIVGGSILAHDHFQGGRYAFAMAKAPMETRLHVAGFDTVEAGIVKWPMSVIRLRSGEDGPLIDLAVKILDSWRSYTDEEAFILAETDGEPHNTITPIARMRDGKFELDLVLRNNMTTEEHPLGVYHPHEELHHIKKENIGLIEVMGLAVLPARLKGELAALADALVNDRVLTGDARTEKHAPWAEELKTRHVFTAENAMDILQQEVGILFAKVLEHAGVYKRNQQGKARFLRFIESIGADGAVDE